MSLSTELSSDFPGVIRARGSEYFEAKKVKIKHGCPWDVDATVRDTASYRVRLERDGNEVLVHCNCPYYETDGACKHIWAVILEADEKGYLTGDGRNRPLALVKISSFDDDDEDEFFDDDFYDEDDEDDEEEDAAIMRNLLRFPGAQPPQKNKPLNWKEQLAEMGRTAPGFTAGARDQWPATRRLIYTVDVPATLGSQYLILDTLIQDRKQDGEWGKPRKQRIPRPQIAELPDALDRQIFAMLAGSREQMEYNYYGYNQDAYDTTPFRYRLSAPLPQIVAPLIARTGRCFLKLDEFAEQLTPIAWDEGEPWRFSVAIARSDKKPDHYEVRGELRRGDETLDFTEPVLMLHGGLIFTRGVAAPFDDDGAFHWISILRRTGALQVPESQIGEFMTEVLSEAQPPRLDLPEDLRYETVTATPRFCLIVKSQQRSPRLRARISFDYAAGSKQALIESDDPRGGVYETGTRRYLLRDRAAEAQARDRLAALGLKYLPPNYSEKKPGWDIAPTKLPRIVRELVAEGWHVEAEGKTFRNPGEVKIQVSSGIDWFELHGTVDFGGATAKLPELLAALRRGDNMVKLEDGAYGMLPEDWLKKYGTIAGLGEAHEDHLRFKKTQVGMLDALLAAQPEADFDESFSKARVELNRFDGVKAAEAPEAFIGELRPYQKDGLGWIHFLRQFGFGGCLADDMGLGKCLAADSLVLINGDLVSAEEIWNRYAGSTECDGEGYWAEPTTDLLTNSISEASESITQTPISKLYRQHVCEKLRQVTLIDGSRITLTRRHQLLTDKGWTNDIIEGDYICVPARLLWNGQPQDPDLVKFLAWQIAEGYELPSPSRLSIAQKDTAILDGLRACILRIGEKFGVKVNNPKIHIPKDWHVPDLGVYSAEYKNFLESRGYEWGKRSREKSIPPFIMQADEETVRLFLRNYFDAEASAVESMRSIEISTASAKLIQQLSCLLRRFGIWLRISEKQKCATNGSGIYRTYYIGTLGGNAVRLFHREIGFGVPDKQSRLDRICSFKSNTNVEGVPASELVARTVVSTGLPVRHFGLHNSIYLDGSQEFSRASLERVVEGCDRILSGQAEKEYRVLKPSKWTNHTLTAYATLDQKLVATTKSQLCHLLDQEVFYCKIKSIEEIEYDGWVYDFEVAEHHNFVANNVLCHNTIQVLALLEARRQLREQNGSGKIAPSLVVVPKSLVFNWKQEAARFTPGLQVLDHTGQFREKETTEHFDEYDLILTTYGTLRNDAVVFKDLQFDYIILDEAQTIKNADTASAKAARLLKGDHRLALSGTPVENHLGELWSMFEFLNPGMLGAASVFKMTGNAARNPDDETRKLLAQALRPFILRRTKEQVAKDLPPKLEQTIFCELEPKQRKLYNELRDHYRNSLLQRIDAEGIAKSKMHVLEALLRLRQAACHPGLIDKKRTSESSAKLDLLLPQLGELFEESRKVLVFSQFTSLLAILKERLDNEKIPYEYLDGKTRDRQARVETFQNNPDCKLFLISLKAGGLGLNLTAAEYVYLLDPWWNPAVEAQAIDRAHRIGQTRQVFAYRIIARDTVEEKVLALQNTKRDLADAIINADNSLIQSLGQEDLELLLS